MSHQSQWGREPDARKEDSQGGVDQAWFKGDRGVSVYALGSKVEVRLMHRLFSGGEPRWMVDDEGRFDGKDSAVRDQAWAWLEGGVWPVVKPIWVKPERPAQSERTRRNGAWLRNSARRGRRP